MDNELDELERVKLERDIAINQLHGYCHSCKNYTKLAWGTVEHPYL